jgi:hypothetical protein
MVTFVDRGKTRPKKNPGYCFIRAGFRPVGETKAHKLIALQLLPKDMPEPCPAIGQTFDLFQP